MATQLDTLLQHPGLWRAGGSAQVQRLMVPSGHAALDARLPGGGWPFPALIEVLLERLGVGELSLLMPALERVSTAGQGQTGRVLVWLNPPHLPYPPALLKRGLDPARLLFTGALSATETLWGMEQALRSGACGAVLAWADTAEMRALRRLKLAALEGACLGFLFRSARRRLQASPATLRLVLSADPAGLQVELVKVQGGRLGKLRIANEEKSRV